MTEALKVARVEALTALADRDDVVDVRCQFSTAGSTEGLAL